MKEEGALIIFQKKPESGKVKTRLAKTIGNKKAVEVYDYLLKHTHQQVARLDIAVFVYFEREVQPEFLLKRKYYGSLQSNGNLGNRMKNAFDEVMGKGYQSVLIIGTDCLEISPDLLRKALQALESNDLVIGPAHDGGYYLLGMNKLHPTLFEGMNWSTPTVFDDTMKAAAELGLKVEVLQRLSDIDVYEDMGKELKRELGIL